MTTATFAYRKRIHLNRFDILVVKGRVSDLIEKGGQYHLDVSASTPIASLASIRGDENSKARMNKLAAKHGATVLEDIESVKALIGGASDEPEPEPKPKTKRQPPPKGEIKGWLLQAFKPSWGLVDGNERWYDVGRSPSKERVLAVQDKWTEAGYICRLKPLRPRVHPVKDDMWDEPSEPIVSRIPGDAWVGDHLGPHLRSVGLTVQQYRDTFGYTGPTMVNRAKRSLQKAHDRIRSSASIRHGMMVAEIHGDRDVTVWQIIKVDSENVGLTWVAGTRGDRDETKEIRRSVLVMKYKMIEAWPNATKEKETK